jgi:hypothetical protein
MNLLKEENGCLLADFHNILNKLKNCCGKLLNIYENSEFKECEITPQETEKRHKTQ